MKVTLAYPYTDDEGKAYAPDAVADLPDDVAVQLLQDGKARAHTPSKSTTKNKGE